MKPVLALDCSLSALALSFVWILYDVLHVHPTFRSSAWKISMWLKMAAISPRFSVIYYSHERY